MTVVIGATREDFAEFLRADRSVDDASAHAVAIAWLIDSDRERLLLVRHRTHGWSCPGGHLERGEAPLDAAIRELEEEVGITATPPSPEPAVVVRDVGCPRHGEGSSVVHWAFGYRFDVSSDEPIVTEAGQPGRWFPLDALPHHRPPDIDEVLRAGRGAGWFSPL